MANKENVTMKFIKQISFQNATANRGKKRKDGLGKRARKNAE